MNEITENAYRTVSRQLNEVVSKGFLLSLSGLKKQVRTLNTRINALKKGAELDFNMTLEKAEKIQNRIYELSGMKKAYQEKIDLIIGK